ncbi:MAG: UDP-N-acetylglucosamine 2-epimerase (non-hydrolyzing) [Rhodothermia bacterium]|nr:UDP-N-acetylglucosamine 2-epimerase (non-hydrolyzing) [Rhodothermia bacterium]
MLIDIIVGARPNFMKVAPIIEVIQKTQKKGYDIQFRLVHTGQHYDRNMSDNFFEQLQIPMPDLNLEAGGGTQAEQTANIMVRYEKVLLEHKPDLCLVVGDVNSTMACSITAKKLGVKVAHVEAGLRSFDLSMPEEINRLVTDVLADYFFTTSEVANAHLRKAGMLRHQIFFVGNTMIDTLLKHRNRFFKPPIWDQLGLEPKQYLVMTLHRPANVDQAEKLRSLIAEITQNTQGLPIVFPVHPRTAKIFKDIGIEARNLFTVEPMSYLEFNYLVEHAQCVITDSGGITEETTVMRVPCITLRDNTERPETVTIGTNELIGTDPSAIRPALEILFAGRWKKGEIPNRWDGQAANRIIHYLIKIYQISKTA